MQVTEEDGGRLNAFAKEPQMVLMEGANPEAQSPRCWCWAERLW